MRLGRLFLTRRRVDEEPSTELFVYLHDRRPDGTALFPTVASLDAYDTIAVVPALVASFVGAVASVAAVPAVLSRATTPSRASSVAAGYASSAVVTPRASTIAFDFQSVAVVPTTEQTAVLAIRGADAEVPAKKAVAVTPRVAADATVPDYETTQESEWKVSP